MWRQGCCFPGRLRIAVSASRIFKRHRRETQKEAEELKVKHSGWRVLITKAR